MRGDDRELVIGLHRSGPDAQVLDRALSLGIRRVDTAFNYQGGRSHALLRATVGPRLGELVISTKVGYFPTPTGVCHSLEPAELTRAVHQSAAALGVVPALVFLHNPEHTVTGLPAPEASARLWAACEALRAATAAGDCDGWGISCWSAAALLPVLDLLPETPAVGAVMVRAGLSVPAAELDAAERLIARLGLERDRVWGMAPFGAGTSPSRAWTPAMTAPFLLDSGPVTAHQGAYRVAFDLPPVARVAVGVRQPEHLHALHQARALTVGQDQIAAYRVLLRSRAGSVGQRGQ